MKLFIILKEFLKDLFFIQIGGEGPIDDRDVSFFQINNYAQETGAIVFALEHRFYGKSQPFDELSTSNLQYLTSQQALADLAVFIDSIKSQYNAPNAPVITFGCSYSGALAAWFRMKYPTVTMASIASSAPVQAILDFYQYNEVVNNSFADIAGEECDNRIQEATNTIQNMLQTNSGTLKLQDLFKTCGPIKTKQDIQNFMSSIMGNFQGVVQYNDDNRNKISTTYDIPYICNMMNNKSVDALTAYVNVNSLMLEIYQMPCLNVAYSDLVSQTSNNTPPNDGKSWTYQTCTEFGYFQTTDSPNQPFGDLVPLSFYTQLCEDVFDINQNTIGPNINATNILYGGTNIPAYGPTNIMFVNGNVDPWHSLGIIKDISKSLQAVFIDGTAHCSNVYPTSPNDSFALIEARHKISKYIKEVLHVHKNN